MPVLAIGLILAVGLVLVGWSPGAVHDPALATFGHSVQGTEPPRQPVVASTEATTTTLYLPWGTRNYALDRPSIFGIEMNNRVDSSQGLEEAVAARMHWLRFDALDWDKIEPVRTDPPTYEWSVVEEESLRTAKSQGFEVIATVRFAPYWAQKVPGSYCGPIHPAALDAFAQFLRAAVERYSVAPYSVHYWELGNEPDVDPSWVPPRSVFGCWGDEGDPYFGGGYYAQMLKIAYPAIKAADPEAQVLIGGLLLDCDPANPPAGKDCAEGKFLEGILRNGGGSYFDIASFHAYTYYWQQVMQNPNWPGSVTAVPEKVDFLQKTLKQYGFGNKTLMNTETAALCFEDSPGCREIQARFIPRAYAEAFALGLESQIYYTLLTNWMYAGLLEPDHTPKPAYHAYVAATSFLARASYEGPATGYPSGMGGATFLRAGDLPHLDVIWSDRGNLLDVTLPPGARAYDKFGQLIATSGTIQVTGSAVYIERP